jgi:hypothetical protein
MHPSPIPRSRAYLLGARLHASGPRALAELILELAAGANPVERIERYARLDSAIVAAVGGSELPPIARALR